VRARVLIAVGIVLILAGIGYLGYSHLFTEPAPARQPAGRPDAAGPPVAQGQQIRVSRVSGLVEKSQSGSPWTPVKRGDHLRLHESIRTDAEGSAVLKIGEMATVQMDAASESSVKEISEQVSRLRLEHGRVSTVVHGKGKTVFRVETRGSDAIAEAAEGEFSVLSSGTGQVAVAAHTGDVRLSARNQSVEVSAGQQSIVRKNSGPSSPEQIPGSLFLKVGKPRSLIQRERSTTVRGRATPGAVISINGVRTGVDKSGSFEATVPLREGKNRIRVVASDASGREEKSRLPAITVDSRAPRVQSRVHWGSDPEKKKGSQPKKRKKRKKKR
jgi:hypothetical protein